MSTAFPTAKELTALSEQTCPAHDRCEAIAGILRTAADRGDFGARFSRDEYPDSDFDGLEEEFYIERSTKYTHVRWY